jgi:superfamily II DNA/RNA helicase
VVTDLASRGLDIPNLDYVLTIGLPKHSLRTHLHRVGRVGRNGRPGKAYNLLGEEYPDEILIEFVNILLSQRQTIPPPLRKRFINKSNHKVHEWLAEDGIALRRGESVERLVNENARFDWDSFNIEEAGKKIITTMDDESRLNSIEEEKKERLSTFELRYGRKKLIDAEKARKSTAEREYKERKSKLSGWAKTAAINADLGMNQLSSSLELSNEVSHLHGAQKQHQLNKLTDRGMFEQGKAKYKNIAKAAAQIKQNDKKNGRNDKKKGQQGKSDKNGKMDQGRGGKGNQNDKKDQNGKPKQSSKPNLSTNPDQTKKLNQSGKQNNPQPVNNLPTPAENNGNPTDTSAKRKKKTRTR